VQENIIAISSVSGENLAKLKEILYQQLEQLKRKGL
jgi:hypothetical protein